MNKIIKKTVEIMADVREAHKGLQAVLVAASIDSKWAGKLGVALSVSDFIIGKYENYLYDQIKKPKLLLSDNEKYFNVSGPVNFNTDSPISNINYFLFSLFKLKYIEYIDIIKFGNNGYGNKYIVGEIKIDNISIKYSETSNYTDTTYCVLINNYSEYLKEIKSIVKETYGNHIICLQNNSLTIDNRRIYDNIMAAKIIEEIEIFQNKGLTRSYLLYGPPGTGKTNLALNVAEKFGSLYIVDVNLWLTREAASKEQLLKLLDYKVIILDDLDHSKNENFGSLFSWMQWLRSIGKIVIATCNSFDSFPKALLRPGRFDRLIEIRKLDDPAIMEMVDGDLEVFELVKEQPAACINEFMQRLKAFGKEEAIAQKDEIFERAKLYLEQ